MDRARLTLPALLGLVALVLVLPRLGLHGLWFDEAYTARLAALDWPRLIAGAQRDIHPPGWPLVAGLFVRLPIPAEWALRLPAALCFAVLVGLTGARNVWAGVALLLYAPLVEQAAQARPYVPLALGLVAITRLVEQRRWAWSGIVAAMVSSLHALGGPLSVATLLATVPLQRPGRRDIARVVVPQLVVCACWLPSFATSAADYLGSPWYTSSSAADWWIVADAGGAAAAALFVVIACLLQDLRALAPAVCVGALLAALELAGIGVEIRKTGIVLLPLLLVGLDSSRLARIAALSSVAALGATSVRIPDRPDLRDAHAAAESLGGRIPVVSVFASEAAWYFRSPAPLPSFREPQEIASRLVEVREAQGSPCIISVTLPHTFPDPNTLPSGLRTVLVADVTGLDVRLVGNEECSLSSPTGRWRLPRPADDARGP